MKLELEDVLGLCADEHGDDDEFRIMVNRASEGMFSEGELKPQQDRIAVKTSGSTLVLPPEYESIKMAGIFGIPVPVRGKHFDFYDSGAGILKCDGTGGGCSTNVHDRGWSPVAFQPDEPMALFMIADDDACTSGEGTVYGIDANDRELGHSGIKLHVAGADAETQAETYYTEKLVKRIDNLRLPRTNGYKYLYAWCPESCTRKFLGRYAPGETNPAMRKYEVEGVSKDKETTVEMIAVRSSVEVFSDDDWLPIDSKLAYRYYITALNQEDLKTQEGLQTASIFKSKARKHMHGIADRRTETRDHRPDFRKKNSAGSLLMRGRRRMR